MTCQSNSEVFRFLDLPPELRNRIYQHVFENTAQHELDLLHVRPYLPDSGIALACRQLRNEALSLAAEATEAFWKTHTFTLSFEPNMTHEERLKMFKTHAQLPPNAKIYRLAILLAGKSEHHRYRAMAECIEEENVVWTFMSPPLVASAGVLERVHDVLMQQLQRNTMTAIERKRAAKKSGLDVDICVEALFSGMGGS